MTSPTAVVEIVTRAERRRFSTDEKLAIVRETLAPGASVSAVARRHGLAPALLHSWRKRALTGAMAGFVPVAVVDEPYTALPAAEPTEERPRVAMASVKRNGTDAPSLIEIALPNGWRVRIGTDADAAALGRVFSALSALR